MAYTRSVNGVYFVGDSLFAEDILDSSTGQIKQELIPGGGGEEGAKAKVYDNYSAFVSEVNAMSGSDLQVGNSVYIVDTEVADLWVAKVESSSVQYTYTTDDALMGALTGNKDTTLQIGYYRFCRLETTTIKLTDIIDNEQVIATSLNELHSAVDGVETLLSQI